MGGLQHSWASDASRARRQECWSTRAKGCNRYDSQSRHRYSQVFAGHDVGVCAHGVEAIALSPAMLPQDVAASVDAAIVATDSRRQRFSLAFALGVGSVSLQLAGHIDAWRDMALREEQLAETVDLQLQRGLGLFNLGLTRTQQDDVTGGLAMMAAGHSALLGANPFVVIADALARAGRGRDALAVVPSRGRRTH